jgi:Tfp pilus assembly protein PilN
MSEEMKIRRYQSAITKNTRKASERIIQLEQENQQLKGRISMLNQYKLMVHTHFGNKVNPIQLEQQNKLYKSVLDEIREYFIPVDWDEKYLFIDTVYNKINEILDKVKE